MAYEINTLYGPAISTEYGPILLDELFILDAELGTLQWKSRPQKWFSTNVSFSSWNARFSGKSAMTTPRTGYCCGRVFTATMFAHRVIFALAHGNWPTEQVDHINGIRCDNRVSNLRSVSASDNQKNAKLRSDNSSQVSGVHWHNRDRVWRVHISVNGKQKTIGGFTSKLDAIAARKSAEVANGYHPNHGRQT